jgi:hypothetical protein
LPQLRQRKQVLHGVRVRVRLQPVAPLRRLKETRP